MDPRYDSYRMVTSRKHLSTAALAALICALILGACTTTNTDELEGLRDELEDLRGQLDQLSSQTPPTTAAPTSTTGPVPVSTSTSSTTTTTEGATNATETLQSEFITGFNDGFTFGFSDGLDDYWVDPAQGPTPDSSEQYVLGYQAGYTTGFFQGRDSALAIADVAPPPVPAPASTTVQPSGPTTEWCLDYQLALEVAGDERARSIVNFITGEQMYYRMNLGHWLDWVADPVEEAGCPRPLGRN